MQWRHHPRYEIYQDINHTYNKINQDDKNDLMSLPLKKNKPPRAICDYPKITMWTSVLGTGVLIYAVFKHFWPMTWYKGYKYSRCCTLYMFVYNDHHYSPLKITPLKGQLQNYRVEEGARGVVLKMKKSWIYDTGNIFWKDVQILKNNVPIQVPSTISIPLRHKIKTRRIMHQTYWDIQYMVKQGTNWCNLSRNKVLRTRASSVDTLEESENTELTTILDKLACGKDKGKKATKV